VTDREEIKDFVQNTLGCTCPEEVYDEIEHYTDVRLTNDITLDEKLKVGRRLLIYVFTLNVRDRLINDLSVLVHIGMNERDALAFNRFRLVIKTGEIEDFTKLANSIFKSMNINDDKVHLHIIPQER